MTAFFALFLAKFMALIPIAVGIVGAFVSRSWWHVLVTAVLAAAIDEIFLRMTEVEHGFSPLAFMTGVIAAGLWAAWFYWLRQAKLRNQARPPDSEAR